MSAVKLKLVRVTDRTEIPLTDNMLVGRLEESGLRITQGMPSRRHAQISLVAGDVWVEDLGSANGTFVNGARIDAKTKLKSRDRVRFDVEEFDFHAEPEVGEVNDDDKTKYRKSDLQPVAIPPVPVQPVAIQPVPVQPPVPPTQSASVQAVIAESSGILKRPGAWADPDSDDGGAHKTKFMDPAALKSMLDHAPLPAARGVQVDTPHLLVMSGSTSGAMIKLQVGNDSTTEWTIGSGPEREIVFIDSGVSALHAKIVNDGARWKLLDQMSANGTFVNGKRSNVSFLSGGDRLRFGPVECELKLPGASIHEPARNANAPGSGSAAKNRLPVIALIVTALAAALLAWWLLR